MGWETDFWFGSWILWKFSKKYVAFLDFVLSCILYKNCSSAWTENPQNFIRKSIIFFSKSWLTPRQVYRWQQNCTYGNQLLKTNKTLRNSSFTQMVKNLSAIFMKMPHTFQEFSQDPRSKSKVENQINLNQIKRFLHMIWPPAFPIICRCRVN